jgi:hypothetical protein
MHFFVCKLILSVVKVLFAVHRSLLTDHWFPKERAVNSAGECHPHTVEVAGSNPVPPTTDNQGVMLHGITFFSFGIGGSV